MESSQFFSFSVILKESFFLYLKTWKFILPISAISIVVPSLFFFPFGCFWKIIMDNNQTLDPFPIYFFIFMAIEIIFLVVFYVIFHLFSICTIIVSAVAYTDQSISSSELLCRVRKIGRRPIKTSSRAPSLKLSIISIILNAFLVACIVIFMNHHNAINVSLLVVLCSAIIIIHIKDSVASRLVYVVSVVEADSEISKAMERAVQLAVGHGMKGFMLNLFMYLVVVGCVLVFGVIVGNKGSLNVLVYGLFFVGLVVLFRIWVMVSYSVFYFQCLKHRGEQEIDVVGEVKYSELPAASV